jgi:hypothetical protein
MVANAIEDNPTRAVRQIDLGRRGVVAPSRIESARLASQLREVTR